MDEFKLINKFFNSISYKRADVVLGIGDDAACLNISNGKQLLVSCDTLVSNVHFFADSDAYDIATKAVMVNLSDIAAMSGTPCWITLALTLPELDENWLQRFALGLSDSLHQYNVALIGGDTTRGPLSITITVHGLVSQGKSITRSGARAGDLVYVSGHLGAAAMALNVLQNKINVSNADDYDRLMQYLHCPQPRVDLATILQKFATSALDISDGLLSDLQHICNASNLGAQIFIDQIPINPLLNQYQVSNALSLALHGGDDYELCFTIDPKNEENFLQELNNLNLICYPIGVMDVQLGLRDSNGAILVARGYNHFEN